MPTVDHQIDGTTLIPRKEAKRRWRDAVLVRSDYCCAYCNEQLGPRSATLDHIIPKVLGGLTVPENLCGACITCNGSKGHRDWREWFRAQPFYSLTREEAIDSWLT
jgi:5-methylcytosine-specific restriction endonuclease McrA